MSLRRAGSVDESADRIRQAVAVMDRIADRAAQIPFPSLLAQIDETHRRGLDLEGT